MAALLAGSLVVGVHRPASAWTHDLGQVTVSESGGLSPRTLEAVATVSDVLGVEPTIVLSGTIRMTRVDRGETPIQSFAPGYAVPMSFSAIDPATAGLLAGAEMLSALDEGVVMSNGTAALRGAQVGDLITLEGWNRAARTYPVSAIVDDAVLDWSELAFTHGVAGELGIARAGRAVMWGVNTTVVDLLLRAVVGEAPIAVSGPGSERRPFVDWVLPLVQIKQRFGEFSYREVGGDRIETSDEWYEANIVTVTLPRLGEFRCHREVMPYVRSALAELEWRGLADEIDPSDFQAAGGCYNARLARGGDLDRGFAISRHSWGIAVDFNPSTNGFGDPPALSVAFGEVMRAWGFAWGAGWRVTDPMHFEWHAVPDDSTREACVTTLAGTDPAVRPVAACPH